MNGRTQPESKAMTKPHPPAKEDRVAAALRENLKKRKAQQKLRATLKKEE